MSFISPWHYFFFFVCILETHTLMTAHNCKLYTGKLQVENTNDKTNICSIDQYGYSGPIALDSLRLPRTNPLLITDVSSDGLFTDNSDSIIPTQKAIKTYVDASAGGAIGDPFAMSNVIISSAVSATEEGFVVDNRTVKDFCYFDIGGTKISHENATGDVTITPTGTTLTVNSNQIVDGTLTTTSTTAPQFVVNYDGTHGMDITISAAGNATLSVDGTKIDIAAGEQFNVKDATNCTTALDGCSTFAGGVGIAQDLRVAGTIYGGSISAPPTITYPFTLNSVTIPQLIISNPPSALAYISELFNGIFELYLQPVLGFSRFDISSDTYIKGTTEGSVSTGSLITDGGILCKKNLYVTGTILNNNTRRMSLMSSVVAYTGAALSVQPTFPGFRVITLRPGVLDMFHLTAILLPYNVIPGTIYPYIVYTNQIHTLQDIVFGYSCIVGDSTHQFSAQPLGGGDGSAQWSLTVASPDPTRPTYGEWTNAVSTTGLVAPITVAFLFSRVGGTYTHDVYIHDVGIRYSVSGL